MVSRCPWEFARFYVPFYEFILPKIVKSHLFVHFHSKLGRASARTIACTNFITAGCLEAAHHYPHDSDFLYQWQKFHETMIYKQILKTLVFNTHPGFKTHRDHTTHGRRSCRSMANFIEVDKSLFRRNAIRLSNNQPVQCNYTQLYKACDDPVGCSDNRGLW